MRFAQNGVEKRALRKMRCIFCLEERFGTEEHVFPLAIGGTLTINRVCKQCNSILGSRVDAALADNFLVRGHRARLHLTGNSGKPPAIHEMLLGVGRLANNPEQRVEITFDGHTRKIVTRALYHVSNVVMPDGAISRTIVVDEKDVAELGKIIQRERKRHGVPLLSSEELDFEIVRLKQNVTTIENPTIIFERTYSFEFVRHALIKIAYELAFLWLGEDYIDDPSAEELRTAVLSEDPASTDKVPAYVGSAAGFEAFKLWPSSETEHLAYAFVATDGIAIAVRVFDIHAAIVWVTNHPDRFLSMENGCQKLRFIRIDSVTGEKWDIPMMDELARIAGEMVANTRK